MALELRIIVAHLTYLVEFCFKGEKEKLFFLHEKELRHKEVHELISGHIIKLLITFELEPVSYPTSCFISRIVTLDVTIEVIESSLPSSGPPSLGG